MSLRTAFIPFAVLAAAVAVPLAQGGTEKIDAAANAKIRAEETDHSQIMRIEHMIADVYGPRPTGSANHVAAANWAAKEMTSWGMKNAKLEPWAWGHEGWQNESAEGRVTAPYKSALILATLPWTPSTNGPVTGPAVNLVTPTGPENPPAAGRGNAAGCPAAPTYAGPTSAELEAYLTSMAPKVKGAIVLVGAWKTPPFCESEAPKRRDDDATRAQYNAAPNAAPAAGRGAAPAAPANTGRMTAGQVNTRVLDFLKTNGAAVRVLDSGERLGIIRV